jgi:hypothetical protein
MELNNKKMEKAAYNGRFGAMAAVSPQKVQCKFASLYPAASSVEAATAPSRWDVVCNTARVSSRKYRLEKNLLPESVEETIFQIKLSL